MSNGLYRRYVNALFDEVMFPPMPPRPPWWRRLLSRKIRYGYSAAMQAWFDECNRPIKVALVNNDVYPVEQ